MVEVVASFGDDVVDVRHIADARPNRHVTWFAAAGVAFLIAAVAFGLALEQVAAGNAAAGDDAAIVMLVGLGLGLALATLATFRWKARSFPGYRIGRDGGVELAVDVPKLSLVAWTANGFVVQRGDGVVIVDDNDAMARAQIAVPRDGRIVATIGDAIRISIARVATPSGLAPSASADPLVLRCFAISLALHAVLWGFVQATPPDIGSIEIGLGFADRYSESITARIQGGPRQDNQRDDDSPDREHRGAGSPMALAAGRAGSLDSERAQGHIRIKKRDDTRQVTRDAAITAARSSGLLGAASITDRDSFRALTGSVDPSSGFDNANVYGPLYGGDGEANGGFGLARNGEAFSAGCDGPSCSGTIGVTKYGTIGNGKLVGDGWGGGGAGAAGGMGGMLRTHTSTAPTIVLCGPGCIIGDGGLDKSIIRRYIRRSLPKIQYCYEKQLLVTHDLSGDVLTDFMIHTDGHVSDVKSTGMNDDVAACIAGVLEHIDFPHNQQGTQVRYPFTFRWSGSP